MKRMVLLTYKPQPVDEEKYHEFIRDIDYPAFRQNPYIIDYRCWRVLDNVQGEQTFTHFDCMEVHDFADWPKIAEDPVVKNNYETWLREYSLHGIDHDKQEENIKITFCEDYWG